MTGAIVRDLEHGLLIDVVDLPQPAQVYGFCGGGPLEIPGSGTAFGFIHAGETRLASGSRERRLRQGEYFCLAVTDRLIVDGGEGFLVLHLGYTGLNTVGGPIERRGRLRYIDGCSDSLLVGPAVRGDPCFNLLHFPPGIDQTIHTHPSIRAGQVHSGRGVCRTESGVQALEAGRLFFLHPGAPHAFATGQDADMLLTVYHPDSDFGPTHDEHPMLNRTFVDGVSARFLDAIRTREEVQASDAAAE